MDDLPLATPLDPPSTAIARACSAGSGKVLTRSVSAEGIVNAAPAGNVVILINIKKKMCVNVHTDAS